MKVRVFFLAFLIVLLLPQIGLARLSSKEIAYSKEANIVIESGYIADFEFETSKSYIDEATVSFKIDLDSSENQRLSKIETNPDIEKEDEIFFRITGVSESQLMPIELVLGYETKRDFPKISREIDFPYFFSDSELEMIEPYLEPTQLINSDDITIKRAGSSIVEGEDDYYSAIMKIASFVEDTVDYTIDSMTQKATQRASWVLLNRRGVCDEISVLFIALLRSVGIPARFVSGIAYTNSELFDDEWGNHGWAEVYFPEYGWVPFDITYKEMGYTNPLRVAQRKSNDAATDMIEYRWASRNVRLNVYHNKTVVDYKISRQDIFNELMPDVNVKPVFDKVGFGSYNAIDAEISNPYNYYVPISIAISTPTEVASMDDDYAFLVLKPKEKITKRFVVFVTDSLSTRYSYILPAEVLINFERFSINLSSAKNFDVYSREFFLIQEEQARDELVADIKCSVPEHLYLGKRNVVLCEIFNSGNRKLEGKACFAGECQETEVFISEKKELAFSHEPDEKGWQRLTFSFLGFSRPYEANVIEEPEADIRIVYIQTEGISESKVLFEVLPEGRLLNAKGKIMINEKEATGFEFDEMSVPHEIPVLVGKEWLRRESTSIEMILKFEDVLGKEYEKNVEGLIILEELSFWDKLVLFFRRLFW
ncbi:MAG TPA: transglutaminase domain-containing protein [Candidatus Woesearchaeota archaeon]|nr:transglutaminase domain-containing protein [Candidatus Woesearchaeota archaeon]